MAIVFTVVLIITIVDASAQFLKLDRAMDLRKIGIIGYYLLFPLTSAH